MASAAVEVTPEMVAYCWAFLESELAGAAEPELPALPEGEYPLFVTWKTDGRDLRGCIGTLSPVPLARLGHYVRKSALEDRRFEPIQRAELPRLHCSVSLLHSYEAAPAWDAWEVGVHGILIHFTPPGAGAGAGAEPLSATYLPEVAREQRWTQEEAVRSLVRKAGHEGPLDLASVACTRYQSSKLGMSYSDYRGRVGSGRSARCGVA